MDDLAAVMCLRTELPMIIHSDDIILSYKFHMPMCNGHMVCYRFERKMGGSSSKEEGGEEEH